MLRYMLNVGHTDRKCLPCRAAYIPRRVSPHTQCHRRSHRSSTTARAPPHTVTIATALLSPQHNATARAHGLGTHLQGVVAVCNLLPDELVGGSGKVARKELYELVRHVLDKVEASLAVALHHEHGKVAAARVSERKTTIGVGWKDHS